MTARATRTTTSSSASRPANRSGAKARRAGTSAVTGAWGVAGASGAATRRSRVVRRRAIRTRTLDAVVAQVDLLLRLLDPEPLALLLRLELGVLLRLALRFLAPLLEIVVGLSRHGTVRRGGDGRPIVVRSPWERDA